MKLYAAFCFMVVFMAIAIVVAPAAASDEVTLAAITKIHVSSSGPDPVSPWQRTPAEQCSGSGAIIEGNRIITNAHVVAHAVDLQVSRHGDPTRYNARTLYVDHERDLALLTVDDERIFDGVDPLALAPTPERQSRVQVLGYPLGGESLSVTEGVLSRFEMDLYSHSWRYNLVAQLDAPINGGNSGGPVVSDGKLVGLAMQTLAHAENVGYCVPTPVIEQFFADIADGRLDGPPWMGVFSQEMHSPALRASLGLPKGVTGELITSVDVGSAADGHLRPGDVLLSVEGHPVADDLTVEVESIGRVNSAYLSREKQVGDELEVTIWRDGERRDVTLTLKNSPTLVSNPRYRETLPYVICGGLVFTSFDLDYLFLFEDAPSNLLSLALDANERSEDRDEAVVLVRVLPHPINQGYQDFEDVILETAMGQTVRNLDHLQEILANVEEEWIKLTFDDDTRAVLSAAEIVTANSEIARRYGIGKLVVSMDD